MTGQWLVMHELAAWRRGRPGEVTNGSAGSMATAASPASPAIYQRPRECSVQSRQVQLGSAREDLLGQIPALEQCQANMQLQGEQAMLLKTVC